MITMNENGLVNIVLEQILAVKNGDTFTSIIIILLSSLLYGMEWIEISMCPHSSMKRLWIRVSNYFTETGAKANILFLMGKQVSGLFSLVPLAKQLTLRFVK